MSPELIRTGQDVLVTRTNPDQAAHLAEEIPQTRYASLARVATIEVRAITPLPHGPVALLCAGAADLPVAEECAETLRAFGLSFVVSVKPLETGCPGTPAETEDGVALARATGQAEPLHALLRLREPVAPIGSGRPGGRADRLRRSGSPRPRARACADLALVEGAGGLLSPLTWKHDAMDPARALGDRVLLVAADRLGTISHTLRR